MNLFRLRIFAVIALASLMCVAVSHGAVAAIWFGFASALGLVQLGRPLHLLGTAPMQRGTAHATFTAPTSTIGTIDATTFRTIPTGDHQTIKDESAADVLEAFQNGHYRFAFTMTVKSGQTPVIKGGLITLTFPASHIVTGAIECAVVNDPEISNYGMVIRQDVEVKYNTAAGDYSP